jgi:uncharacterized cupredoxin-like copper-binding protein
MATVAIVAMLGLAACGGDDDETTTPASSEATETTEAGGGTETVDMEAVDFEFTPNDPTVKAGQVKFSLTNDGQTLHNLLVQGPSGDQELPMDIASGESGQLTMDLSKPGTYEFYCPVGNHRDLGMVGKVKVQ